MTAAVRAQLLAASAKIPAEAPKKPATPRSPLPAPKEPREPGESLEMAQNPKGEILTLPPPTLGTPGGPCSWLLNAGLTCIALAAAHFGDRYRVVLTCPKDPGLLKALLAAAETYYSTPKA